MLKKLLVLGLFCFSVVLNSQVTNEGNPLSWTMSEAKTTISSIKLPKFDMKMIKAEDEINDAIVAKPYRFGYKFSVNYGLQNAGEWIEAKNGDRIWRILFESERALTMNFLFDSFYIPRGGKVYLYSNDRSDLLGAYTHTSNQKDETLGTWIVKGDKVWIEYYEPKQVRGQGKLHISNAIHGYRNKQISEKLLGESGDCNHDVDCPIGADFETQKDLVKKGVALLLINGQDWCTGTLVNNTDQDKKPYILTADHCLFDPDGTQKFSTALISARFNWISPNPVCAAFDDSTNGPTSMVLPGASLKAHNSDSDFVLLEMTTPIPTGWDVTFAGWDRTDIAPSFVVGIHHPSGDIMKICRDDSGVIKSSHQIGGPTAQTWDITSAGGGWELGVTETGSSGSALFDTDGRIIGQLFGGAAACIGTNDNDAIDFYGRFAVSWDNGGTAATQLKDWLDPSNSVVNTLDALENVLAVNDEFLEQNISIFPNPTSGNLQIKTTDLIGELKYEIFNVLGQKLATNTVINNTINIGNLVPNIYFVKLIEINSNRILVEKIILTK